MGIFDLFKDDDDYKGNHSTRGRKGQSFDASEMETTQDVLNWIKENKVIVLSEDGGLVVYTDEDGVNFIQAFTDESQVTEEEIDEFATVDYHDFVALFDELGDVDYAVLNPSTDAIILKQEEFQDKVADKREAKTVEDEEKEESVEPESSEPDDFASQENESELSLSESMNIEIEFVSEDSEEDSTENESEDEITPEVSEKFFNLEYAKFDVVKRIPSILIKNLMDLLNDNLSVQKIYVGSVIIDDVQHYAFHFDGAVNTSALHQDQHEHHFEVVVAEKGSTLAGKLEKDEFLIFEISAAKNTDKKRSEEELLEYIQQHQLLYPYSEDVVAVGATELITFSNFTHIPTQFLLAFDSFVISTYSEFIDFLEENEEFESIHVNPFTDGVQVSRDLLIATDERKQHVLLIGLGMIGSSIGLGMMRENENARIYGYDKEKSDSPDFLYKKVTDLAWAAKIADFIILATPVEATIDLMKQLSEMELKEGVVITDTGSTKLEILKVANEFFDKKNVTFVGGHPMVATYKSDSLEANENLFDDAYYMVTEENESLKKLLEGLHSNFIVMSAEEHDAVTGQISHFPRVLASSLILQTGLYSEKHPMVTKLVDNNFLDMTRIADGNTKVWTSILLSNSEDLLDRIENFKGQLDDIAKIIKSGDEKKIKDYFEMSKRIRITMETHKNV